MEFTGKCILAPMVRFCSLPTRALALDFDFDIVYGPEIIAQRIIGSERFEENGVVLYKKNGIINFSTRAEEKSKLVFQLGCSDPELALKAAETVKNDVNVIDLNCGCPKPFSIKGKMGAALLDDPDLLCSILVALKSVVPQVTCKIRVFDDLDKTLKLVQRINATGISALAVHARTRSCSRDDNPKWEYFEPIKKILGDTPLIANGNVFSGNDIMKLKRLGCDSFMVARGAMRDMSMFRKEGQLESEEICELFLKYAIQFNNNYQNTKWILLSMYPYRKSDIYRKWTCAKSLQELGRTMNLDTKIDNCDPKYDSEFPYIPNRIEVNTST
eukprot:NODE_91_length_21779_cov_0.171356.p8 type:complete len:329 gc:universal NODE_91_length_21779_cov_0.171356:10267-11253(+)